MRIKDLQKAEAIRSTAIELVASEGLDALTMSALAKKVGISPSTLYVYFETKDDLVMTLFRETIQEMEQAIAQGVNLMLPYKVMMRAFWDKYLDYTHKNQVKARFVELVKGSSAYRQKALETKMNDLSMMQLMVTAGIQQQLLKQTDPKLLVLTISCLANQLAQMLMGGEIMDDPASREQCFQIMWDAISA